MLIGRLGDLAFDLDIEASPAPARAAFTNALAWAAVTLLAWTSNVALAKAICPDGEICDAPRGPYGEEISETCG